jgi:hypothetical protein
MKALEKINVIPQDEMPASMPIPQVSSATTLINVMSRAALDPSVDIDKLERLIAMYERAIARDAEQAFNEAMTGAQTELRPVAADANNPQTKSKYATYAALDAKARPIYTRHGFCLTFNTAEGAPDGCVRVVCDVARGAHSRTYHLDMPADGKGAKGGDVMTKTHATGAAMTYGRRYLLGMIFNLVIGEDTDGNMPTDSGGFITEDQVKHLIDLCDRTGSDKGKFCQKMKFDSIPAIRESNYQRAVEVLKNNAKIKGIAL